MSADADTLQTAPHVDFALQYEGCLTGECDQLFLGAVGLQGNHNYCAAFVSYILEQTQPETPTIRSARVADFISPASIEARHVIRGSYQVQAGDIIIWAYDASHTGFSIEDWQGLSGRTIEANTSPAEPSMNPALRGVFVKQRSFSPGSYFRPRYVTQVAYRNE